MSSIIRVQKSDNYVVMNRTVLNDARLSWKAKGILVYMLSMPDDWTFYMDELVQHATDGERSFRAGFKELQDCGYVVRRPIREGQRIKAWETIVHEVPQDDSLLCGFEDVQKQQVQNEDVQKLHVQNSRLLSTDTNQVLKELNTENNQVLKKEKEQEQEPKPKEKKKEPSRKQVFDDSSFELQMANLLFDKIKSDVPTFRKPNLQAWADQVRLMHQQDGLSEQQIEYLINWATSNSFWKANILSTKKLRDKATTLIMQIKAERDKAATPTKTYATKPGRTENLPEWFATRNEQQEEQALTSEQEAELEERRKRVLEKLGYTS